MRKLMVLMAILVMTTSAAGCGRMWGSWWNRGSACGGCSEATPMYDGMILDGGGALVPPSTGYRLPPPIIEG